MGKMWAIKVTHFTSTGVSLIKTARVCKGKGATSDKPGISAPAHNNHVTRFINTISWRLIHAINNTHSICAGELMPYSFINYIRAAATMKRVCVLWFRRNLN